MINISSAGRNNPYTFSADNAASVSKSSFNKELAATSETAKAQAAVPLSEGSYEERLERLRELHKNTDYSGLSGWDRIRLIRGRFYEAFGSEFGVIDSGFYKPLGENTIYAEIYNENSRQELEVFDFPDNPSGVEMARNFRYSMGYENLSDDEIRQKIAERYSGGTLADRYAACWELFNTHIDANAASATMTHISDEMVKATEAEYGHLFRNNPIRVKAMFAYATGTKASWSELVKGAWNVIDNAKVKGGPDAVAVYEEMKQRIKEQLFEFLDHMNYTMTRDDGDGKDFWEARAERQEDYIKYCQQKEIEHRIAISKEFAALRKGGNGLSAEALLSGVAASGGTGGAAGMLLGL